MKPALVLFAHGSRDPEWSAPFRAIQAKLAARRPDVTVELAFLEAVSPALDEVLDGLAANGHTNITVAPLFMAQGGHLKRDVPRLLEAQRARHPGVVLKLLPAIGEVDALIDAIGEWLSGSVPPA